MTNIQSNHLNKHLLWSSLLLLLVVAILFGPLAGTAWAKGNKVSLCHLRGNGSYKVINVSENALDAHLNHGDKIVGVDVDENCEPLGLDPDADSDGVLDAEDNCVDVANPGQEDRYGTTAGDACEDLDGDGTPDVNEANFCLSIDGALLESRGTAVCDSITTTGQESNIAIADGDLAEAYAGVNSDGTPSDSNNNQATALGYEASALATSGDNNNATATGDYASAGALGGNNNSAIATGESAYASANFGNNNSATATGYRASAQAYSGDNNSATATGDNILAVARDGNNNSATATTTYTCAGKGDSDETAVNEDLCQPDVPDADNDGVADAEDNCVDVANPGQEDRYGTAAGDACEDLDGDGTLDVNESNFCLSIDGALLESRGTAICSSDAGTNIAVANGDIAEAAAGSGSNNSATAIGDSTLASVGNGNNNSAIATGYFAYAQAYSGDNNQATATGENANATAADGSNNSALADGAGASATAGDGGNNNSATATGDNAFACAGGGDSDETAVNEDLCQPHEPDADNDGVADAEDNCVNVANPGQEDRYGTAAGDACEDLDGDGTLDVNESNFCLSIDGALLESRGTAVCDSTATTGQGPNVAVANGNYAAAYAGVDSTDGSPLPGDNNSATAIGEDAYAFAGDGDNNSATAIGVFTYALAFDGDNNSATTAGDNTVANASTGDNNSATATGDNISADAFKGNNNSATATTTNTCAGNGDSDETAVNEDLCSN